jgi:hypothetical protein
LAELLLTGKYVDDMAASKAPMEELKQLIRDAEVVFKKVNILCKGWTFDGEDPPEEPSIGVADLTWFPKIDVVACVFDLMGLLSPVLANLRLDTRRTSKAVNTWDEAVPADLRQKWVKNFW